MRTYRENNILIDPVLPGFELPLGDIFS
jgi:hypothetical protein